jgi:hypothetical protein
MKIALILAAVAVATNLFLVLFVKRKHPKTAVEAPPILKDIAKADSKRFFDSVEGKLLKHSAAAELDISMEELDCMSVEEITQIAQKKQLI